MELTITRNKYGFEVAKESAAKVAELYGFEPFGRLTFPTYKLLEVVNKVLDAGHTPRIVKEG